MSGVLRMAWLHMAHHRGATALLVGCLGLTLLLPGSARVVVERYEEELTARARATPLVLGPKGNRFDLTLGALYFSAHELDPLPFSLVAQIAEEGEATPIPLYNRFTARKRPIVCTTPEYYELRGLRTIEGHAPLRIGDATLGARAAARLGLRVGDTLPTDPTALYDLARPVSFDLKVRGIFAPSGTADDEAVFCDVKTAWVLEGIAHGHPKTSEIDEKFYVARNEDNVSLSGALIEHSELTDDNLEDFHVHTSETALPLSSIVVVPKDARAETILNTRFNLDGSLQMVRPREVIDELLAVVFSVRRLVDLISLVLGTATVALTILVLMLSSRLRARERDTLHRIGCAPGTVARLFGYEIALVVGASALFAFLGTLAVALFAPTLSSALL